MHDKQRLRLLPLSDHSNIFSWCQVSHANNIIINLEGTVHFPKGTSLKTNPISHAWHGKNSLEYHLRRRCPGPRFPRVRCSQARPGQAKEERESDHRLLLAGAGRKWKNGQFSSLIVWEQRSDEYSTTDDGPGPSSGHKKPRRRSSFASVCKSLFSANTRHSVPVQQPTTKDRVEVVHRRRWKKRPN